MPSPVRIIIPMKRTAIVTSVMVERGLESSKIEADDVGAADPLVPDSDYANRWQNRRTAIFLVK